jgi:hypothetical protein
MNNLIKDLYIRLEPAFQGPLYATLVTLLAVIAGVLGSVYSPEIGRSFPLYWGPYDSFSLKALLFWSTLIVQFFLNETKLRNLVSRYFWPSSFAF